MHDGPAHMVIEHRSVWEQAYGVLRAQILDGRLAPGVKLNMRAIAAQLDISVTPVRDAALRLASEGLVENAEGRGLSVTQFTEADILHTLDLRTLLEVYAIEQSGPSLAKRIILQLEQLLAQEEEEVRDKPVPDMRRYALVSRQFHHEVVAAANDRVLLDLYERLHAYVVMERAQHGFVNTRLTDDHAEHIGILATLRRGDHANAAHLMREHLTQVKLQAVAGFHRQGQAHVPSIIS
jgi:DNA-binding GntR family transcriptional regulator